MACPCHRCRHPPSTQSPPRTLAPPPDAPAERLFRKRYKKSPSFLSVHAGVRADALPPGTECHHIIVEDWVKMQVGGGAAFLLFAF